MRFNLARKALILIIAAGMVSLTFISPSKGQSSGDIVIILQQILQRVDNLPAALVKLGTYIANWTDADTTDASIALQGSFSQLGKLLPEEIDTQNGLQPAINNYLLGNKGGNIYASMGDPSIPAGGAPSIKTFPYANDLTYSTVLGAPLFSKDPRKGIDPALNYILNASGANIFHEMPGGGGYAGIEESQRRYQGFYNTVMAATSFNSYILSSQYADKSQFSTLQKTLIQQSTDQANWFAKVSSENIGIVLRQILMYQSQTFVLLTQMIQLQRQMVSAVAMNTAVLIAANQLNEASMLGNAKGQRPKI